MSSAGVRGIIYVKIIIADTPDIPAEVNELDKKQLYLGVDVGTTSICAAVNGGGTVASFGLPGGGFAEAGAGRREQSPDAVLSTVRALIDQATAEHPGIRGIGLDGQMHGVVYLDGEG